MTAAEYTAIRRSTARGTGACQHCFAAPARPGRTTCVACATKAKARIRQGRHPITRRNLGLTAIERLELARLAANRRAEERRDVRRFRGICIDSPLAGGHGPVVKGGRCDACWRRARGVSP